MSELTKQYFDKQLGKLATKEDLKKLVTKNDLKSEIGRLELKVEDEIANLARMTADGFEEIKKKLDVRKDVENLDRRVYRVEQALNIKN